MPFTSNEITFLESLAITAGNAIMRVREDGIEQSDKADGSPVTQADLRADEIIRDGLQSLAPDICAITEETFDTTDATDTKEPTAYWCVDPLDGTKSFIRGRDNFTVNIAFIEDRKSTLGVIYAPAKGVIWVGAAGKAWKREAVLTTDTMSLEAMSDAKPIKACTANINAPCIIASSTHRSPVLEAWIGKLTPRDNVAISSSLKFCLIAEGTADLYPRTSPTMEWDTAAGQAIVEAAGGRMVDANGKRFSYGKMGRRNGYFAAMGIIEGETPPFWMPPHEGNDG